MKEDKKRSFLSRLYDGFFNIFTKKQITNFLRQKAVKFALKKILKSAAAGGIKGWLLTYIVEHLFDELAKPVINLALRKLGYYVEVQDGKKLLKSFEEVDERDDWRDLTRHV